ncbi:MAG: TRM11 family SAM-dependent methyltransferase [Candidatus Lutacidiplasmatales archaeon]
MDRERPAVIGLEVELSLANPELGRWESVSAAEAVGGGAALPMPEGAHETLRVWVPSREAQEAFCGRIALARRILRPFASGDEGILAGLRELGRARQSAAMRRFGHPRGPLPREVVGRFAGAYVEAGGRIDLDHPERRFWFRVDDRREWSGFEEVGVPDPHALAERRMPKLPFQRPVSLAPRLARAAANLARVRPGDRVVDPFVGTGALLLEAGLLGAKLFGVDRDDTMARGALRNMAAFDVEAIRVDDAESAARAYSGPPFDALLTDPPYGRASGSGGEPAETLIRRVLPAWAAHVRPAGRIVVVVPGGPDPLSAPWERRLSIPDRVHRSLTREFRVYERSGALT